MSYSDPFGLCTPMPECLYGLGGLQAAIQEVGDAIKSIPSQIANFASAPLKGGFVANLAMVPLTVAGGGEKAAADLTITGTKAAVRGGLEGLGLGEKVLSGVRGVLSSGRADQVMVQATSDGGANVLRWVKGDNTVSSAMYHYVIDNTGKVVGAAKQAYDKAGAIAGTFKVY